MVYYVIGTTRFLTAHTNPKTVRCYTTIITIQIQYDVCILVGNATILECITLGSAH